MATTRETALLESGAALSNGWSAPRIRRVLHHGSDAPRDARTRVVDAPGPAPSADDPAGSVNRAPVRRANRRGPHGARAHRVRPRIHRAGFVVIVRVAKRHSVRTRNEPILIDTTRRTPYDPPRANTCRAEFFLMTLMITTDRGDPRWVSAHIQPARDRRAVDQGGQSRHPLDAPLLSPLPGQRCPPPARGHRNLANLLRRLVLLVTIQNWSLTSLQQRLFRRTSHSARSVLRAPTCARLDGGVFGRRDRSITLGWNGLHRPYGSPE